LTARPFSSSQVKKTATILILLWIAINALALHFFVGFNWPISIADSTVNNILLALACIVVSNMLGYYHPKIEPIAFVFIISAVLSAVVIYGAQFVLLYFLKAYGNYVDFYNFSLFFRGMLCFICLFWCALTTMLWYKLEEQSEAQNRLITTQSLAKEAELNKLRHQLQPHFLFNSLNSVFALTMINPKEAGVMITKLASFLRGTLKRDDEMWLTVEEEMDYIQLYLDIEKVRFSHRLSIEVSVDEETLNLRLPGTLLQPIVENAIKFGLYNTSKAIIIKINVFVQNDLLHIKVQNPFDPEMKVTEGTGFGLNSIKRRLYLLFANTDLLQTNILENNLFITTLKIPQLNDKDNTH
jgi:two-component system LytT family sensor kinase